MSVPRSRASPLKLADRLALAAGTLEAHIAVLRQWNDGESRFEGCRPGEPVFNAEEFVADLRVIAGDLSTIAEVETPSEQPSSEFSE